MASAINKITGQYIKRGIPKNIQIGESYNNFTHSAEWIINPSEAEIEQYKYKAPISQIKADKIAEIQAKTDLLHAQGFDYDNKTWASDAKDMRAWNFFSSKILTKKNLGFTDEQIFPMVNKLRDKAGNKYDLVSHDYLDSLLDAGEVFYEAISNGHWSLVQQVEDVDTGTYEGDVTAINAIVDNR